MQSKEIQQRQKRMNSRRAWVLTLVYVLFLLHLLHWKIYGETVSPAELNEAMFTIEQGIITVGTILLGLLLVSVLLFGRFFCSWACHILALQDLSSWLLKKAHIKPKSIRSRILPLVAVGALFYMFVWPTVVRIYEGSSWAGFRILTDQQGFGSLTTAEFTRNLPGPFMTTLTFITVGLLAVLFLGSRGFCRFVCPYGALFAIVDRVSPAGIQLKGQCDGCGHCTAACTSNIQVHHEIQTHGRVVSPTCMKDLDCVMSCPKDAISFGYGKIPLTHSFENFVKPVRRWPWTWWQEIVAGIVCIAVLLITRTLYGEVPFLLALTLGVIYAWATVTTIHLMTKSNVRVFKTQLRLQHTLKRASTYWIVSYVLVTAFFAHSGWIRWHEYQGQNAWNHVTKGEFKYSDEAIHHLNIVIDDGIWRPPYADRMLADVFLQTGQYQNAVPHLEILLQHWPNNQELHRTLLFAQQQGKGRGHK